MKNAHDKKKSFIKNKSNMKIYVIFILLYIINVEKLW